MNDQLPQDVVAFLKQEFQSHHQQEDDITVAQAADVWGICKTTARTKLKALVKEGKMVELYGKLLNGGTGAFYRVPGDKS